MPCAHSVAESSATGPVVPLRASTNSPRRKSTTMQDAGTRATRAGTRVWPGCRVRMEGTVVLTTRCTGPHLKRNAGGAARTTEPASGRRCMRRRAGCRGDIETVSAAEAARTAGRRSGGGAAEMKETADECLDRTVGITGVTRPSIETCQDRLGTETHRGHCSARSGRNGPGRVQRVTL